MPSPLSVLACLLCAITTVSAQDVYTVWPWPKHPQPAPPVPVYVTTTAVDNTWIVTCPAPSTVYINVTEVEYVPLTATTTASEFFTDTTTNSEFFTDTTTSPITIVQTIISTSVITTVGHFSTSNYVHKTDVGRPKQLLQLHRPQQRQQKSSLSTKSHPKPRASQYALVE